MTKKNLVLTWILEIFIAGMVIGLINLGLYAFFPSPKYETYCPQKQLLKTIEIKEDCEVNQGYWNYNVGYSELRVDSNKFGYCDLDYYCRQTYDTSYKEYNNIVFYILAIIGFLLTIIAIFNKIFMIQLSGVFSGSGLVIESIIRNFNNTKIAFFTLLLLIIVIGYFTYKKFKE